MSRFATVRSLAASCGLFALVTAVVGVPVTHAFDVIRITDNGSGDFDPAISSAKVVWRGNDGHDYEIYLWDGSTTTPITDNDTLEGDVVRSDAHLVGMVEDVQKGHNSPFSNIKEFWRILQRDKGDIKGKVKVLENKKQTMERVNHEE